MSSIQDLLKNMALGPATSKWDIVCSYSIDQLNKTLANAYAAQGTKIVKEVKITCQQADFSGQMWNFDFDVLFDAPEIQFIAGVNGTCTLSMLILKGSCASYPVGSAPTPPVPIPDKTYSVNVSLPLVCASGDGNPVTAGTVISFGPAPNEQANITLHFKTTELDDWKIVPTPDSKMIHIWQEIFLPVLLTWFEDNVTDIDYSLAGVTNAAPNGTDIVIIPKSFVFASFSDGTNGVLSLYIQTTNMTDGQPGDSTPAFEPGGDEISPIPDGYQASLIFSREFLQEVFLKPRFSAQQFNVVATPDDPTSGTTILAAKLAQFTISGNMVFSDPVDSVDIDDTTVDLSQYPFTFEFGTDHLHVTFSANENTNWCTVGWVRGTPIYGPTHTAGTTISVDKMFDLSKIAVIGDNTISIDCAINPGDFSANVDPGSSDSCWDDHSGDVISNIQKGVASHVPSITLALDGLYYFQVTNLLFPGQNILKMDAAQGIHVPRDLILVGGFVTAAASPGGN